MGELLIEYCYIDDDKSRLNFLKLKLFKALCNRT